MTLEQAQRRRRGYKPTERVKADAECQRNGHRWRATQTGIDGGRYCTRCFRIRTGSSK